MVPAATPPGCQTRRIVWRYLPASDGGGIGRRCTRQWSPSARSSRPAASPTQPASRYRTARPFWLW